MFGNIQVARILGIPLMVNLSWLMTLGFVTTILALRVYPEVLPENSSYRDDHALLWAMALASGLVFFASIVLHELAHSLVARKQGLTVQNITLFVFGGVSQIGGEARRPLHEFVMAIIGPLTSLVIAGIFFLLWWLVGLHLDTPVAVVLYWLLLMNLAVAIFNMAPGFPMDGGRVLRSLLWGLSGNLYGSTRIATILGRVLGFGLMFLGGLIIFGTFRLVDPWTGLWCAILGLFLETSARQSWLQAKAFNMLSGYKAQEIMTSELEMTRDDERLHVLLNRDDSHFIYFVADQEQHVVGVVTEKEAAQAGARGRMTSAVADVMMPTESVTVAQPDDDGARLLQTMEAGSIWHMPVVNEGQVIGVVSKESLLRLIAHALFPGRGRRRSL